MSFFCTSPTEATSTFFGVSSFTAEPESTIIPQQQQTKQTFTTTTTPPWHILPAELQLAVVDLLVEDPISVKALSKVDVRTYRVCVHAMFKDVTLGSYEAIESFLENVPREYLSYIESLEFNTSHAHSKATASGPIPSGFSAPVLPRVQADTVIQLLSGCTKLHTLSMKLNGSLDKSVVCAFSHLSSLRELEIRNVGDECRAPVSERLVVAIACTIPYLTSLTLDNITRSKMHAPELEGVYPCPPLCLSDTDIPVPSALPVNTPLSLPSLLLIPSLKNLTIKETHLGDDGWTTTPVLCKLETLDIGSCYHSPSEFNTLCTERIMSAVGESVQSFSLATPISFSASPFASTTSLTSTLNNNGLPASIPPSPSVSSQQSHPLFSSPTHTPLAKLRKLHISPFFPVSSVVSTITNLQGSPVERISVQCFEEDVVDVCGALEEFLSLKVQKGEEGFYKTLKRIDVSVTKSPFDDLDDEEEDMDEDMESDEDEEKRERLEATRKLQDFCRDLQLQSMVDKMATKKGHRFNGGRTFVAVPFAKEEKKIKGKARSNTI